MESKHVISRRQLFALMGVGLLSPIIRLLPKMSVFLGGTATWLSPLAAIPGLVFLAWIGSLYIKDSLPGEGLGDIFCRYLGTGLGRVVAGIYGLWILVYAGFILRAGAERLLSTIYGEGHLAFFMIVVLLVALLAAQGRLRALGRSAEVFMVLLIGTLVTVLIFSLPQLRVENLFPVYAQKIGGIFLGAVPVVDVLSPWLYLLFLYGYVQRRSGEKPLLAYVLRWQGLLLLLVFLLMLTTIGCFGQQFLLKLQSPFFTMARDVQIFNVVERIESVVIGIWVIADFCLLATLLSAGSEALRGSLKLKKRRPLVYIAAAFSLAVGFFIARTGFGFAEISEKLIPGVNLVFVFLGLPLICLIGKIRKKGKKGY